jgi:hypothetical protein
VTRHCDLPLTLDERVRDLLGCKQKATVSMNIGQLSRAAWRLVGRG